MKKIAFLINQMDAVGGTERVVANLSAMFQSKLGVNVSVITMVGEKSLLPLHSDIHFYSMQTIPMYKKGFALRKYLKNRGIDTLVSVGMTRLNIWLALMLPLLKGVKVIATEHVNMTQSSFIVKLLKRILFIQYNYFVVLTQSNELLYKKWGMKNVITIPNSNAFDCICLRNYEANSKIVLTIGRLVEQKNFMHLLIAWNEIFRKYPDWKLHIVGEGAMENEMRTYIKSKGMENSCFILPFTNDVQKHYAEAQIFVMSSLFEGLPMVLLEAPQFGIPCVSYDCETGPRDIIVVGENGFLAKNQDPEDLAKKISQLMENDEMRYYFHEKSLIYSKRFSKKSICQQWAKLL